MATDSKEAEQRFHNLTLDTIFAGERLCLDFINTLCMRRTVELEFLGTVDDLRGWLINAEAMTGIKLLNGNQLWRTEQGTRLLAQAIELRSALRSLVESTIDKQPPSKSAVDIVNSVLRANAVYQQLTIDNEGRLQNKVPAGPDDNWLAVIARDAVDLLCSSDLNLIRQCDCPTCIRLFYDNTKNHRRRWCCQKCGSAPKAAAYYRRKVSKIKDALTS